MLSFHIIEVNIGSLFEALEKIACKQILGF